MTTETEEKPSAVVVDVRNIDPSTGTPWTDYMDGPVVVRYLGARGIKRSLQTLAHQRAAGIGIKWRYLGQKPIATREEIDRHIDQDLFRDVSPLLGKHRGRKKKPAARRAKARA
jgi:hypothetical protein